MTAGRDGSLCLFCRTTRVFHDRPRLTTATAPRRWLQAVAMRSDDTGRWMLQTSAQMPSQTSDTDRDGCQSVIQSIDNNDESVRDLEQLISGSADRVKTLQRLSKSNYQTSSDVVQHKAGYAHTSRNLHKVGTIQSISNSNDRTTSNAVQHKDGYARTSPLRVPPEANAGPIPHAVFRERVKSTKQEKLIRQFLREQLLLCQTPREVLRVMAVAMQNRHVAEQLLMLPDPIRRAMFRCRNLVSDPIVLRAITTIVARFSMAGMEVHPSLLQMGVKFAARARSRDHMRRYLSMFRRRGLPVSSNLFRSIVAKFSIGFRGLGEIRNGRWRRAELLQVLTGFAEEAQLPLDQQTHLGTFMDRSDWQYLYGWIAVLARCKASDTIWQEWLLWKTSEPCARPKRLASKDGFFNSKTRGDYWFVEQMANSGDTERAWQILKESGLPFSVLRPRISSRLLDDFEHATFFDNHVAEALLEKYDQDLTRIERSFGVCWEADEHGGEGKHVLFIDQEEAMEKLSVDNYTPEGEECYGYPYDDSPLVTEAEQNLHDAEEKDLIQTPAAYNSTGSPPSLL